MTRFETALLRISFIFSVIATTGSLYFSEVMNLPPCVLCWYQRICMYPLVLIFGVGLWEQKNNYIKFAFPLVLIGLFIAIYHNLLYYGVIPESITPCSQGIPCTARLIDWFGFITIPLLSLTGFISILLTLILTLKAKGSKK